MGHIFISYSKKDIVYAEKLINTLRREGFNPWVDMEGLGVGTFWQTRLLKQIKTCDAYLLIMSKNAYHSRWVPDELVTAKTKGKPIFPLLLDDTELFLAIQTIQFEDVRGGKMPSEEFYRRLAAVTQRRRKASEKIDSIRLIDREREKKADEAAEKASFYMFKFSSNMKDMFAVASKVSARAYKSMADSDVVKKIASRVKPTSKPVKRKKRKTPAQK